jgi:aminoglycoside phosphotransferase (APT) family kinase protein
VFAESSSPFSLPHSAFEWLSRVLGYPARRLSLHQMQGSTSSTLYRVSLQDSAQTWVLRCFTDSDWLSNEPDLVDHESAALTLLAQSDLPAPHLAAADPDGQVCGVPSLLMTSLPGRVDLTPQNFSHWFQQMAQPLEPLHAVPAPDFHWRYYPYVSPVDADPPAWSNSPELWQCAIEIDRQPWPSFKPVFIHRDFHPVNVLFDRGQLSGLVDWPNACLGPADFDIAWCRMNLSAMFGIDAANTFLKACRDIAGNSFTYNPFWDILAAIEVLPGPPETYPPWQQFGLPFIPVAELILRHEAFLKSALQQIQS